MSFKKIHERAIKLKGEKALKASLPEVRSATALSSISDADYLEEMSKCIFRSGFVWKVVENKWPAFQKAFASFNPRAVAHFSDEKLEALTRDASIIRNGTKIRAVRDNAQFMLDTATEYGSFGKFLAQWPAEDITGLQLYLKKHGSRLGGHTGQYFLRFMGKDTFMFSKDVVAVLIAEGIVDKEPTSKSGLASVQAAFNAWHEETGLPLSHLSRIMAASVNSG
jgi:3-methyladenine DNA glycosylase Tag